MTKRRQKENNKYLLTPTVKIKQFLKMPKIVRTLLKCRVKIKAFVSLDEDAFGPSDPPRPPLGSPFQIGRYKYLYRKEQTLFQNNRLRGKIKSKRSFSPSFSQ